MPALFQQDTDIAARCFDALSFEPAGVKAAVQEATSLLSAAYHPSKLAGTTSCQHGFRHEPGDVRLHEAGCIYLKALQKLAICAVHVIPWFEMPSQSSYALPSGRHMHAVRHAILLSGGYVQLASCNASPYK